MSEGSDDYVKKYIKSLYIEEILYHGLLINSQLLTYLSPGDLDTIHRCTSIYSDVSSPFASIIY